MEVPDGENYADAERRASDALEHISTRSASPLIVTHEMIGRMLLRVLLNLDPSEAIDLSLPHGSIFEVAPVERTLATRSGAEFGTNSARAALAIGNELTPIEHDPGRNASVPHEEPSVTLNPRPTER